MSKQPYVMIMTARCRATRQLFGPRFEEVQAGSWVADWAFVLNETVSRREGYDRATITGQFGFDAAYPGCPYCGATSLVKCGCGKVSCWDQQDRTVTCPWCGDRGEIRGTIESLDAGGDR